MAYTLSQLLAQEAAQGGNTWAPEVDCCTDTLKTVPMMRHGRMHRQYVTDALILSALIVYRALCSLDIVSARRFIRSCICAHSQS